LNHFEPSVQQTVKKYNITDDMVQSFEKHVRFNQITTTVKAESMMITSMVQQMS
jgi:hypothetical protein